MSRVRLLQRDLRVEGLAGIPDVSMDGCLCDPPYGLRSDGRALTWDDAPSGSGFMGKAWDAAVPGVAFWKEVLRVLKPGASLLAFGGTRTYHRLVCAIEDAGFEIRDSILCPGAAWIHGQGFPKSLDISKSIDRMAGADRREVGRKAVGLQSRRGPGFNHQGGAEGLLVTTPATIEAQSWEDYGTALKPAWEPIVWAMKPLGGTYAENALRHGVAGLNIEGSRIGTATRENGKASPTSASRKSRVLAGYRSDDGAGPGSPGSEVTGRWPANVILCHLPGCREAGARVVASNSHHPANRGQENQLSGHHGQKGLEDRRPDKETVEAWECAPGCPVAELNRQSGELTSGTGATRQKSAAGYARNAFGVESRPAGDPCITYGDSGGAARFFYCAKVSPAERNGSKHPTLKPVDLCRYLATLILPPARPGEPRRLLVPFAGEGSEIIGALAAGWEEVTGIELDEEHLQAGARRIRDVAPLIYSVELELGGAA